MRSEGIANRIVTWKLNGKKAQVSQTEMGREVEILPKSHKEQKYKIARTEIGCDMGVMEAAKVIYNGL